MLSVFLLNDSLIAALRVHSHVTLHVKCMAMGGHQGRVRTQSRRINPLGIATGTCSEVRIMFLSSDGLEDHRTHTHTFYFRGSWDSSGCKYETGWWCWVWFYFKTYRESMREVFVPQKISKKFFDSHTLLSVTGRLDRTVQLEVILSHRFWLYVKIFIAYFPKHFSLNAVEWILQSDWSMTISAGDVDSFSLLSKSQAYIKEAGSRLPKSRVSFLFWKHMSTTC